MHRQSRENGFLMRDKYESMTESTQEKKNRLNVELKAGFRGEFFKDKLLPASQKLNSVFNGERFKCA